MAYNKVVYGGNTLIDLTDLDVTAGDVLSGVTVILADGTKAVGTLSVLQNLKDGSAIGSVRGVGTTAEDSSYTMGNYAFAEGSQTTAAGLHSHAENNRAKAYGNSSHAQGYDTYAMGNFSTACGNTTRAYGRSTFVIGEYNSYPTPTPDADTRGDHAFIIGNGTSATPDSNALTVDWSGNVKASGGLTLAGHSSAIGTRVLVEGSSSTADVSVSAGGWVTIGTISLSAGTWIVNCRARYTPNASGNNYSAVCLGVSSAEGWYDRRYSAYQIQHTFVQILQPTATTTYYLRGNANNAGKFNRNNGAAYAIDAVRIV